MGSDWKEPIESAEMVSEPTIEQFVYYFRLVEGDVVEWRATRQRAFQMDLLSLAAHLSKLCGRHVEWSLDALRQESADPYLSQPLFNSGWISWGNGKRACHVEARSYSDVYCLHIRYHWRGSHPASLYQAVRREDLWTPSQDEQMLGQSLFLAGMVDLESAHPLAAQILNLQNPPRQGIGDLQTCSLGQARVYRGSLRPEISVLLYAKEGAEQAIGSFLERWAIRWELHRHKLVHELVWGEGVGSWLEEQAARLREALSSGQMQEEAAKWEGLLGDFQERLETCLRRENAIQSDLSSLEWIVSQLPIEGPDTYFAAALKPLRARRQQLASLLINAQRARDEAVQTFRAFGGNSTAAIRGDLSRLLLNSRQAVPVLEALNAAKKLPPWSGRGWAAAEAIYYSDVAQSAPNWSARRHEKLLITIGGPRSREGYSVRLSSSLGEAQSWLSADELPLPAGAPDEATPGASAQGERLFRALFGREREETFRQALALARATGRGLALRLNIEQSPELEPLPWESVYDAEEGCFVSASGETPLARCPAAEGERYAPNDLPLRLLVAVAAPSDCERFGLAPVSAEKEVESVRAMLRPALEAKWLKIETVTHASPGAVRQAAVRFRPHILQLISHGVSRRDLGHALLEDETGRGRLANARVLLEFLLDDEETRLVLLSPPEQMTDRSLEALVGLAGQLHQSHSKAVITLRQGMDTRSRQRLWREFYRALLPWNAVDVALAEARRQMLVEQGESGPWSAPILFLPGASGRLFHAKGADKR